ncbi:MAG: hypothetical protein KGK07_14405 [Chloroflexota bacterium]|nr:hypothetical protein [Chloroflexota bacterium]
MPFREVFEHECATGERRAKDVLDDLEAMAEGLRQAMMRGHKTAALSASITHGRITLRTGSDGGRAGGPVS